MGTSRREFLAAAMAAPGAAFAATGAPRQKPLKVCVFADIHYQPGVYVNDTPEFLEKILARAQRERCDMVVHLGDFVHTVLKAPEKAYVKMYNESRVPAYHCLGNHDSIRDVPHLERAGFRILLNESVRLRRAGRSGGPLPARRAGCACPVWTWRRRICCCF